MTGARPYMDEDEEIPVGGPDSRRRALRRLAGKVPEPQPEFALPPEDDLPPPPDVEEVERKADMQVLTAVPEAPVVPPPQPEPPVARGTGRAAKVMGLAQAGQITDPDNQGQDRKAFRDPGLRAAQQVYAQYEPARKSEQRLSDIEAVARIGANFTSLPFGEKPNTQIADMLSGMRKDTLAAPERMSKIDSLASAAQAKADASNPDHPSNVSFREIVKAAFPNIESRIGPEKFSRMVKADLEKVFPAFEKLAQGRQRVEDGTRRTTSSINVDDARIEDMAADNAREDLETEAGINAKNIDQDFRDREFDWRVEDAKEKNRIAEIRARRQSSSSTVAQAGIDRRFNQRRLTDLGKATEKVKEVNLYEPLKTVLKNLPGIEKGSYTFDPREGGVDWGFKLKAKAAIPGGTNAMTPNEIRVVQAADNLKDLIARARTGAVINADEEALYRRLFGTRLLDSPDAFVQAVQWVGQAIYRGLERIQSTYPDVLVDYETLSDAPSYRDAILIPFGGRGGRGAPIDSRFANDGSVGTSTVVRQSQSGPSPDTPPMQRAPLKRVVNGETLVKVQGASGPVYVPESELTADDVLLYE